ncbi:diguanylate cyclase [Leptolyngbya sp. 7M]|nr:diguanylate cyclase [Leptolyngbya sp. 7M]
MATKNVQAERSEQSLQRYVTAVMVTGALLLIYAVATLPIHQLDWRAGVLAIFTVGIASRVLLRIPSFKAHIAISDIFIYLTLLMFGGEAAIILAAADTFASAWRFCNKYRTILFNTAALVISTSAVYLVLFALGLYSEPQLHGYPPYFQDFLLVLCLMALTQFSVNTALAGYYDVLNEGVSFRENWKKKYLWSFLTYIIGAIGAGMLVQLVDYIGFGVALLAFPILILIYMTYRMYLTNVEMSVLQAEKAEDYARQIEERSAALRESEERFRSAFNYAPIGIGLVSPTGQWVKVNHALCHILGYSEMEMLKSDFQSVIYPDDLPQALMKVNALLTGHTRNEQLEQRYLHKSGRMVWVSWSVSLVGETNSEHSNLIFQLQNITEKKLAQEKLHHDATHDPLTELPNRSFFMEKLAAAISRSAADPNYKVSVLFIDLDRFKYVNDSLGHLFGDRMLVAISERLRDCMRPTDTVARLGGDEFTVLVEGFFDQSEVVGIAERIQSKFKIPFELNGHQIYSSASIGILNANEGHHTPEDVMRDADTAMYQAKRAGKARHEIFNPKMHTAAKESLRLETDLRSAIHRGELKVLYQPIYRLADMQVVGIESLARWEHPQLGSISPERFIPLAEEIGWIDALGDCILRKATEEIAPIIAVSSNSREFKLSVNLSSSQFGRSELQSLLYSLAGNISRNRRILTLAGNFVDFVNVDNAALGCLYIQISNLQQPQQDIFYIFTDIARLGEGSSISDCKGNIQHLSQRLGQQSFAAAGWSNQQNVGFL